jgi:hypothetical protein
MKSYLKFNNLNQRSWLYLLSCLGAIWLGNWVLKAPDIGVAILVGLVGALCGLAVIAKNPKDRKFLVRVFWGALLIRWIIAIFIYNTSFLNHLIGDATTYDWWGIELCRLWEGLRDPNNPLFKRITNVNSSGWGMAYYVAAIYYIIGQNALAANFITACFGAASAVVVYKVVLLIIPQPRIARIAALLVACTPSLIVWSSQAMKDGLIVFCLGMCALYALKLREKIRLASVFWLLLFLFCLFSLRHYVFYIFFISIAGALVLGAKNLSPLRIARGSAVVVIIGILFVYFGAQNIVEKNFDLKRIQAGRVWSAGVANTGFGSDVDITDTRAAIGYLPIGTAYVLLAPFPWMINSLGQLITLPELILWWFSIPFLIKGFWYAVRHHLQESLALCLFTVGLTLVYALYQSNVGTAYRHRTQLYVFFFIFISIGWEMRRNAKALIQAEKDRWYEQIRNRHADASV